MSPSPAPCPVRCLPSPVSGLFSLACGSRSACQPLWLLPVSVPAQTKPAPPSRGALLCSLHQRWAPPPGPKPQAPAAVTKSGGGVRPPCQPATLFLATALPGLCRHLGALGFCLCPSPCHVPPLRLAPQSPAAFRKEFGFLAWHSGSFMTQTRGWQAFSENVRFFGFAGHMVPVTATLRLEQENSCRQYINK